MHPGEVRCGDCKSGYQVVPGLDETTDRENDMRASFFL
jgi:hypothetical protein